MSIPRRLVRWALQPAAEYVIRKQKTQLKTAFAQLIKARAANAGLAHDVEAHKRGQNTLRRLLEIEKEIAAERYDEITTLRATADKLGDALDGARAERDQALAQVVELEEKLAAAHKATEALIGDVAVLIADKTDLRKQVDELSGKVQKHYAACAQWQAADQHARDKRAEDGAGVI